MSVLPGHENMKSKEVFGFDADGNALVDYGDEGLRRYKVTVTPQGTLHAEPRKEDDPSIYEVDQIGGRSDRPTLAQRMRGVDQIGG